MTRSTWRVSALLFSSGACALIYQTSWLRQFRVIFGTSTYATAAVLAIFMAGLGFGSAFLGKRADRVARPLAFYGSLEIVIALSAAITPLILALVRWVYVSAGGSVSMGLLFATVVRLILSALVLAIPTFLMGGTLPAAARAVESSVDVGRKRLALLYGANTLGAVTGTLVSTFYLLEHLGNRNTLFVAVVVNVIVGVVAIATAGGAADFSPPAFPDLDALEEEAGGLKSAAPQESHGDLDELMPRRLVLIAAGMTGFAFLLMELVWYRMLSPLLGGTTFMFGLILAVALAGIGLGGAAYSLWSGGGRASAGGFALSCTLEAAFIVAPFVLGDRLALITLLLRPVGTIGFAGYVLGWTLITSIVVFPAAFISGVQFPLLISLLGRGRDDVGRDVGHAYAWNTAGAIIGSLLGGFGLLPLLSAPGTWQLVSILLALLGLITVIFAMRARQHAFAVAALIIGAIAVAGTTAMGPTAPWRHSGIGAGRAIMPQSVNDAHEWMNRERRTLAWDADGRESSIALYQDIDLALVVNGKSDGTARGDAGTQVMSGMLPALLASNARRASVVGLGTGTTAGWLASIPTMERVDVVELEPVVVDTARDFAVVNRDVLHNPKVHIELGDAREILVTSREQYDLIFSEPSNPYRAGIASLYTQEFYRSAAKRLTKDGLFAQWMQVYNVDAATLRTVYGTLSSVFPHVETWSTTSGDLLLLAATHPIDHDIDRMRARLRGEPFRSAAHLAWRAESAEAVLAHFVASENVTKRLASSSQLNTDDRTVIEFSFARSLGGGSISIAQLVNAAKQTDGGRPTNIRGAVDWRGVAANRAGILPTTDRRSAFVQAFDGHDFRRAAGIWRDASWQPVSTRELMMIGYVLADAGDENAMKFASALRGWEPIEAAVIAAQLRFREGRVAEAAELLRAAYVGYRTNPWPTPVLMHESLATALALSDDRAAGELLFDALSKPFSSGQWSDGRRVTRIGIAEKLEGCGPRTIAALQELEPNMLWRSHVLAMRAECYHRAGLTEAASAASRDLETFRHAEPAPLLGAPK